MMVDWADTNGLPPPVDHPYETALWLIGRHPQLADLVEGIPGAVDDEGLDLEVLADTVRGFDAYTEAWAEYRRTHYEPQDEARWEVWRAAGPKAAPEVVALAIMSGTEQGRVRLLAYWAGQPGVALHSGVTTSFDAAGQRLVADWCDAVRAQ